VTDDDQEFGGCLVFLAPLLIAIALGGCIQKPEPVVLWCVDDDGRIVPVTPELVRRGRVVALGWGRLP
jgi:hypothetical protein